MKKKRTKASRKIQEDLAIIVGYINGVPVNYYRCRRQSGKKLKSGPVNVGIKPVGRARTIKGALRIAKREEKRIRILVNYFVPTEKVLRALKREEKRRKSIAAC